MPGISNDQLESIRQITLLDYFQRTAPNLLVHTGNAYRTPNGHSSLTISADGTKWHWFAGHVGGRSALDYLVKVEGIPFLEAVERLSSATLLPAAPAPPPVPQQSTPFTLPAACRHSDRVVKYLTGRGIPADMVQQCVRQGTIYESYPHHNCVFVGKDPAGTPRFASLRGTLTGKSFRMDQPGSEKRYGFRYIPPGCSSGRWVVACESPIDALSYAALNRRYGINPVSWDRLPVISLSGTAPAALLQYLRDHPDTDTVYLALDNDVAGRNGAQRIAQAIRDDATISQQVTQISRTLPSTEYGKDYNEMLQTLSMRQQTRAAPIQKTTLCHDGTR